ncbi:MAG: hypothetical protein HY423_03380 [Candidatus Lambdaproteobacteria bacterium]|nr:hypothetical protein [Candidatus Lambdaproteobacteria bacterium]
MGSKQKAGRRGAGGNQAGGRSGRWLTGALIALGALAVVAVVYFSTARPAGSGKSFRVTGGETRAVLAPHQFGKLGAFMGYAAAQRHRDVMDHLYCYCQCDRPPSYHKSLLSCFVDQHGANCDVCQEQARQAGRMADEGKSIDEIRTAIDRTFG